MKRSNMVTRLLARGAPEVVRGRIPGLPVEKPVEVLRDRYGIPHIFAASERDLYTAQGFVHAQDRLWQMETLRRLCSGKLAELVGEAGVEVDVFTRLAGLPGLWARALERVSDEQRTYLEAYAAGVNAYITGAAGRLPLEFRSLGQTPTPWTVADVAAFVPYLAWNMQLNYLEELLAILSKDRIIGSQWNELFASHPGAVLREEEFFAQYRDAKFGKPLPAALALNPKLGFAGGGSNAWAVANAEGGAMLANDPHLGVAVPPIWYFCHLSCPTLDVAGASVAGTPGVVIGRNQRVAWGFTAVHTDYVDLYAVRLDPSDPTTYYVRGKPRRMEREDLAIPVAGRPPSSRSVTLWRTEFGPVITSLEPGVTAAACLKWYGTIPGAELDDTSLPTYFAMQKAESVKEITALAEGYVTACFNMAAADADGHVGFQAFGRVPVRKGYTGRVPADGSSGKCSWSGFLGYSKMPHLLDPESGRVVTANERSQTDKDKTPLTYSWCAPTRANRINQLLDGVAKPTADDFARLQQDLYSLQAERLVPTIVAQPYTHPDAVLAASLLRDWDRRMTADSAGALVYGVFGVEFARTLAGGVLRDDLGFYLSCVPLVYGGAEKLLDPTAAPVPVTHPLLQGRSVAFVCEEALVRAMRLVRRSLGPRRSAWKWGNLHTYRFRHLGASGGLASWLLNRGRYPAPGSESTLNAGPFNPAISRSYRPSPLERYEVETIPSLRLISTPADPDANQIVGPMGQSGQPGSRHYDDLLPLWQSGQYVKLPLTREGVEAVAVDRLVLDAK